MSQRLSALLLLVACGKSADQAPPPPAEQKPPPPAVAPAPAPTKPQPKDTTVKDMLAKGTACKLSSGQLPLDCPEYKAIGDYAFQHQGSTEAAETCAAFLTDPDTSKKLLAAECLFHFNSVGKTPVLGFTLDAVDAEKDPAVLERITWGIMSAEAVTAKLEDRVMATVTRLEADPKTDDSASHLFDTLFPQYLMSSGPKPPAKAQAMAIAALTKDGTALQRRAFDAVKMIDDKAAVCAAIDTALQSKKNWQYAADAIADLKDACVAKLASAIDVTLAHLPDEEHLETLERYDSVFDLDAPTRAKIAKTVRAAKAKAPDYRRKHYDATAAAFSKPPIKK